MINIINRIKNIKIVDQLDLDHKKLALIALVSAVVFYLDVNFIFKAQIRGLGSSRAQVAQLRKDLDNFKLDFKKMRDLESQQAHSSQKPILKSKYILSENQFSGLLRDISKIANQNEVGIVQLKPSRLATEGRDSRVKPAANFIPFSINLDLSGGYHNLGKFINAVENLPAFVKVQDIKLWPQEDNYFKQKANVTLVTYVKK